MEQRRAKRWQARLRSAKLFDSARRYLVECRVLDLSLTGARLQPLSTRPLPLLLHYCADDEELRPARLVWSKGSQIGIAFAEPLGHGQDRIVLR